jgi:hypothetical protein
VGREWVKSEESNIGAPVGIEKSPSQDEEHGNGDSKHGMKLWSSNQGRGD